MRKIKVLFSFALILTVGTCLTVLGIGALELRESTEHGTLKLTFVRNQVSDSNVVFHNWNRGAAGSTDEVTITKNGTIITADFPIYADALDSIGVIPALDAGDGTPDWDNKLSYGGADLTFDVTDIKGSGVKHAFVFENAKADEVVYSSTDLNHLMLVSYYSPSYEDNLGFHSWGMIGEHTATEWGTPLQLFKTIGRAPDGTDIKGAILEASTIGDTGALVYAGSDDTKKHSSYGDLKFNEDSVAGTPQFMAVANGTVFTAEESNTFVEEAFQLKFVDFGVASNGSYTGTYAVNSQSVIGSLSTTIEIPKVKVEADLDNSVEEVLYTEEERVNLAIDLFEIYQTNDSTKKVEIESIDFDKNADSVKDFVFTLKGELSLGTSYTIAFDDTVKTCEAVLNMDKEAPSITLLRGKDTIEVPWGEPFDMKLFPQYEATDDRDGDITAKVFVPSGLGTVDTSKEGDYKVTLRVIDAWGNTTDKVITFTVTK
ncbi:MAG: DUF5011 domain-containing protein [bacterium]